MKTWTIPMPKEAPRDGLTHLAIATKDKNGQRVEFKCQIDAAVATELVAKIIMEAAIQPPKGADLRSENDIKTAEAGDSIQGEQK